MTGVRLAPGAQCSTLVFVLVVHDDAGGDRADSHPDQNPAGIVAVIVMMVMAAVVAIFVMVADAFPAMLGDRTGHIGPFELSVADGFLAGARAVEATLMRLGKALCR